MEINSFTDSQLIINATLDWKINWVFYNHLKWKQEDLKRITYLRIWSEGNSHASASWIHRIWWLSLSMNTAVFPKVTGLFLFDPSHESRHPNTATLGEPRLPVGSQLLLRQLLWRWSHLHVLFQQHVDFVQVAHAPHRSSSNELTIVVALARQCWSSTEALRQRAPHGLPVSPPFRTINHAPHVKIPRFPQRPYG